MTANVLFFTMWTLLPVDGYAWDHMPSIQSAKLSFQSSELAPPRPLTRKRVLPPPPLWFQGGETHACGRVGGRSQFGQRDRHSGTPGIVHNPSTLWDCLLLKVHKHEIILDFFLPKSNPYMPFVNFRKKICFFSFDFRQNFDVRAYAEPNFLWEISKYFFSNSSLWSY